MRIETLNESIPIVQMMSELVEALISPDIIIGVAYQRSGFQDNGTQNNEKKPASNTEAICTIIQK